MCPVLYFLHEPILDIIFICGPRSWKTVSWISEAVRMQLVNITSGGRSCELTAMKRKRRTQSTDFHHRRRRVNKLQKQAATGKAPPCWTEEHGGGVNEFLFIWKQCEDINDGVFTCKYCFTIGSIGLVTEVRNVRLNANLRWHVSMFADATCHPSTWCWLPFDIDSELYRVFRII